jgi:hypothetical protein
MKTKEYVYLWVLDFNDGQVYKYNIERKFYNEEPEYCEDYMQRVGHEISNVQWMVTCNEWVTKLVMYSGWYPLTMKYLTKITDGRALICRLNTATDR